MKRAAVLTLAVFVFCSVVVSATPKIQVDADTYNFESAVAGTFVTHKFVITNVGDTPLSIRNVRTSCGCTVVDLTQKVLAPGKSVDLEAKLNTNGYLGKVAKTVYVESDDQTNPTLVLHLSGVVEKAKPFHMSVGDLEYMFYLLIDLRTPDEYASAHLLGAINVPYDEIGGWIDRFSKNVLLVFYDEDGTLGDQVAQMLNADGFADAKSLMGGFDEWADVLGDQFVVHSMADE